MLIVNMTKIKPMRKNGIMSRMLVLTILACMSAFAMNAEEKYQYNEFYFQRSSLFELLPVDSDDIVFWGNSLTNGCEWHELFGNPNIKNRGISSDVIQGLIDRSEPILQGHPRKVFILSGVNDISHNLSADSVARVMEKLIVKVKTESPNTKIYLQSLLPINNDFGRYKAMKGKEGVIIETNKKLESLARKHGIVWIDLYSKFVGQDGKMKKEYTNDGLHLLGAGYIVWRDAIIDYVND